MAAEDTRRKLVRLIVPLAILTIGGGIAWMALSQRPKSGVTPTAQSTDQAKATSGVDPAAQAKKSETASGNQPSVSPGEKPTEVSDSGVQTSGAPANLANAGKLVAREFDESPSSWSKVGSASPKKQGGTYELELTISGLGAGVEAARLANHFTTITQTEPQTVQQFSRLPGNDRLGLVGFAADSIVVDAQPISLWLSSAPGKSIWKQVSPGVFQAIVENQAGEPQVRITRAYELAPGSFEFTLRQTIENVSSVDRTVRFSQFGPKELAISQTRYGGDVRRARFGYVLPKALDPDQVVLSGDSKSTLIAHSTLLGKADSVDPNTGLGRYPVQQVWPTDESSKNQWSVVWAATTDRYFAAALHEHVPGASSAVTSKALSPTIAEKIERLSIASDPGVTSRGGGEGISVLRLTGAPIKLTPGSTTDVSVTGYVGPLSKKYAKAEAGASRVGLDKLVIFTFGGPCAFCTFQPVAEFLRWFLGWLHDLVFHDWALSIMFLVVCVRGLLHPVTRWSQTNMLRFGKHMGRLGPKMKAIQEKYAGDQTKMREETARLMREEHVSYASGAMGCLPMFLQMPVWVALYAMLFFTFELRHEHAFYGLVQSLSNHKWAFLGDLSEPDHFIGFGTSFHVPLLSGIMGPIEALNILPLVMGVVFYIQQKYMQPPTTATMTPEMEQQQKIMKVMTVVMFPLFMYNAPCGLALYFLTNSTLGILESKWVRARAEKLIEREEAARAAKVAAGVSTSMWDRRGKKNAADAPKPTGFFARLQKLAEDAQKLQEQKRSAERKNRR